MESFTLPSEFGEGESDLWRDILMFARAGRHQGETFSLTVMEDT